MRPEAYTGSVVANLDDDPYAEVALWDAYHWVTVLEHDGSLKWRIKINTYSPSGGYDPGPIVVADADADGFPEIVVAQGKVMTVLERDGTMQWQMPIVFSMRSAPTVFDFDRDGYPEVAFRDKDGVIKVWDGRDGTLLHTFDTGLQGSDWWTHPILADLDGDGHAEMVLPGPASTVYGGLYVYESPNDDWAPMRAIWNQWQYYVTHVNEDGTIPREIRPHWLTAGLNTFRLNERLPEERDEGFDRFVYRASDGVFDSNDATVDLTILPPVNAAQMLSTPVTVATVGYSYTYQVQTYDPDPGDVHTFALSAAPAGMTIDATGLIQWVATQVGSYQVGVIVTDLQGLTSFQAFTLTVGLPVTVPDVVGLVQADAEAALVAADLGVGPVTPVPHPTIPAGSVAGQDPAAGAAVPLGTPVALQVSTGPDTAPPVVTVSASPATFDMGGSTTITVAATDNGTIVGRTLTVDGTPVPLDSNGQATYTISVPGLHTAVGTATDAAGNRGQDTLEFRVRIPGDTTPPTVALTTPSDGAFVTDLIAVIGTADDPNFCQYTLELQQQGGVWVTLATGTSPVVNGVLGTIDPTILIDDPYQLRLRVCDLNGNTNEVTIGIGINSQNLKVGQFTLTFTDLQIPVSGIPITILRTYDSRDKVQHDFGIGWQLSIQTTDVKEDENMNVFLTLPDGRRVAFAFTPQFLGIMFPNIPLYRPAYTATSGSITYTLTCPECASIEVTDYWGPWIDPITFEDFNPDTYILTALDGTRYTIDQADGLQEWRDPNNNTLTFTHTGIIHSSGKSVLFTRDAQDRITAITDPLGNAIQYTYDGNGDLVGVTDREGNTSTFTYDADHYLIDMLTPDGVRVARNEYDANGRLIATIDRDGNRFEYGHDLVGRREVVTDPDGSQKVFEYDDRGNVITEIDEFGNVTSHTYDANGNETSTTNPLGGTSTYTYDSNGFRLSQTDPLGNTTTYTRDVAGRLTSSTDPLGNTTTYTYDGNGNVLTETDALGNITQYTYDAQGNLKSVTDKNGNVRQYEYDTHGNRIKEIDALGNETTYTYDTNGNQLTETKVVTTPTGPRNLVIHKSYDKNGNILSITDPENNTMWFEYDALGNKSATIDSLGRRTETTYNTGGKITSIAFADGMTNSMDYDFKNNLLALTNRAGQTTKYSYDAADRPVELVLPDDTPGDDTDNRRISVEYSPVGTLSALTYPGGVTPSEYEYDIAGRLTTVRNPACCGEIQKGYDAAGRETSITDALGRTTQFGYDAVGRRVQTIFPDGTSITASYDAMGNVISRTDQAGKTTHYEYDALSRLTAVIDPLDHRTEYSYDEVGNLISQTDANGHVTRFEYDGLGRRTAIIRPMGERAEFVYDAVGNLVQIRDFNGEVTTLGYNSVNKLVTKIFPDGSSIGFFYAPSGKRSTVTDSRGITQFQYDVNDRLVSRTEPDGTTISYTYDIAGNVASITTPAGTTTYTYDAGNRLSEVTNPDSGKTTYAYDAVGNLIQTIRANGTVENRQYDTMNRVVYLENLDSNNNNILSSYSYNYDARGNITTEIENTGRRVDYSYDDANRLVLESITDPVAGNRVIQYTYDAVGNRLTRDDSGVGVTTYTYDVNDRLISETTNGVTINYTYDANGNVLTISNGIKSIDLTWSAENRLVGAVITGPSGTTNLSYEYNEEGIRVTSIVDGVETRYLIDANRQFAQVIEEYTPGGTTIVPYVYGNSLLSQVESGQRYFYMGDAHSGIRQLADTLGSITDQYDYDAFGRLLNITGTTPNNYLYRGEQFDPYLEQYYLRARYYSQNIGRFISVDPRDGDMQQPMSLHRYVYANANPIMFMDPSGELASVLTAFAAIALFILITGAVLGAIGIVQGLVGGALKYYGKVEWAGPLSAITVSVPVPGIWFVGPGGAFLTYNAKSNYVMWHHQCTQQEHIEWWMVLFGAGVGSPISFTVSDLKMYSPQLIGPIPGALLGAAFYVGYDIIPTFIGGGSTGGTLVAGFAWSPIGVGLSLGFEALVGGVDILGGFSFPVSWNDIKIVPQSKCQGSSTE
jgi:RHS repeat-associated protein